MSGESADEGELVIGMKPTQRNGGADSREQHTRKATDRNHLMATLKVNRISWLFSKLVSHSLSHSYKSLKVIGHILLLLYKTLHS